MTVKMKEVSEKKNNELSFFPSVFRVNGPHNYRTCSRNLLQKKGSITENESGTEKKWDKKTDDLNERGRSMRFDAEEQLARSLPAPDYNRQSTEQRVHELNSAPDRVRDTGRRTPEGSALFPVRWYLYAF